MAIINTQVPQYINDLVNARIDKGETQMSLSAKLGITNSRLCSYERGRIKPSAKMLEKWCDELQLIIRLVKT